MKLCFKKGLALVMAVLMVMSAFSTIAFAADDDVINVNCEHKNNEVYSTKCHAPTCSSYGYDQVNFCHDCGFYYIPDEHVLAKTGHDYEVSHAHLAGGKVVKISDCKNCEPASPAVEGDDSTKVEDITAEVWELTASSDSCTLGSDLTYKCTWEGCDETRVVLGDGHDYVLHFETIVKPTCEKDGKLTVTCNDCSYKADVIIYKLNKNNGKCNPVEIDRVEPDCTNKGLITYECSECHAITTEEIDALGHDDQLVGVNAEKDCVNDYKCARCGEEYSKHNEAYIDTKTVEATCQNVGYTYWICLKCGEHGYDFEQDRLPHTPGEPVKVDATCTTPGSLVIKCKVCNAVISQSTEEENPALGHDEGEWVTITAPNCRYEGKAELRCTRCDAAILDKDGNVQTKVLPIEADSHDRVGYEVTTAPTCDLWGEISLHCMLCGKIDNSINNINHPNDWWEYTPAVQEGDKTVTLDNGVVILAAFDIRPVGHKWGDVKETQKMTCVQDGIGSATCEICGKVGDDIVIAPSNPFEHDMSKAVLYTDHEHNRPATCTQPEFLYYYCPDCKRDFAEPQPGTELGHGHTKGFKEEAAVEPTCEADGKKALKQCLDCNEFVRDDKTGELLDGSVIKALGHAKVEVTKTDATCTKSGWNMDGWYCERCGAKSDAALAEIPALGHDISYKKFDVTCDKDGFIFYGCTRCGLETLEASFIDNFVYATGHKWETGVIVAPTCDAQGYTMDVCTVCGATNKYDYKDALGHVNADGVKIPEKCFAEFDHEFDTFCVTCKKNIDVHAENWFVTHQPGSCIWEYQYDLYLCTVCKYQEARNIDKDPYPQHIKGDSKVIVPPTHGKAGVVEYSCKNPKCDYKWTEEIPALSGLVFNTEVSAYNINTDSFTNKAVNSGYIAVTITMVGSEIDLWGVEMSVSFNNEVLVFDAEKTEAYNAENVLKSYFNADGAIVNIAASYTENAKENYTLDGEVTYATLFFKVNADKYNLDLNFAIVDDSDIIVDKDGDELVATCNNADAIHVYELGNVLVDEKGYPTDALRNIKDANAIMDMLAAPGDDTDELADIDKDGIVTVKDFQLLMLIIVDQKNYVSYIE